MLICLVHTLLQFHKSSKTSMLGSIDMLLLISRESAQVPLRFRVAGSIRVEEDYIMLMAHLPHV